MLGSYIFKHITAKLLPKTKSSTIDRGDLVLEWTVYCKRLSSTISKQDFNQNVAATMTQPGARRGLMMPGVNTSLYAPLYEILVWRNVRNTDKAKLPAQTFATCKKIITTKTSPQVRIKKRKSCAPRYANNSNRCECCETYVQRHRILQVTLSKKKQSYFS